MRLPSLTVLLAAVLAAALPALAAENRGVPVNNGDKASGAVEPVSDSDCFRLELGTGSSLTVSVKASKGSDLLPTIDIRRPGGTSLNLSSVLVGEGTSKVSVKNLPIPESGLWAVCIGGSSGGATGGYDVSFKFKTPKKSKTNGIQVGPSGTVDCAAAGLDGAFLTFALKETSGGPLAGVDVVDPAKEPVPGAQALIARNKTKVSGKNIPLQGGLGDYAVRMRGAAAAATVVDCQVAVKFPKVAKRKIVLGPEPTVSGVLPGNDRDGATVAVTGTNFVTGVRVFFGTAEASAVAVGSTTELTCTAPGGTASTAGATVDVIVLAVDGQEGIKTGAFTYKGVPAVSSVTPMFRPVEGGGTLTVAGSHIRAGATITIGGVVPGDVVVTPPNLISCTAPARSPGVAAVVVTDEFGRPSLPYQGLVYLAPPTLTSASPSSAPSFGGTEISLTGNGFQSGTRVFVDSVEVTPVTVVSGQARFAMPAGVSGAVTVEVRDGLDQSATRNDILTRARSFHDRSATSVPAAPAGTDFFASALALGDIDKDGDLDLLVAANYPRPSATAYFPAARLFTNNGAGVFTDVTATRLGAFTDPGDFGQADWATLGDIDGNGAADAILSREVPVTEFTYVFTRNAKQYAYYTYSYSGGQGYFYSDYRTYRGTQVLKNNGSGTLATPSTSALPATPSAPFFGFGERWQGTHALGDVDGDAKPDLVIAQPGYNFYATTTPFVQSGVTYLREAETAIPALRVMKGSGTGTFSVLTGAIPPVTTYSTTLVEDFSGRGLVLGNVDGVNGLDIVVVRERPRADPRTGGFAYVPATRVLLNNGSGVFTPKADAMPTPQGATVADSGEWWQGHTAALGDLDGDGDLDLVVGRQYAYYWYDTAALAYRLRPALRIFRNNGTGAFSEATGQFLPSSAFETGSADTLLAVRHVRLGDLDGDGKLDVVTTGLPYYVGGSAGYGTYGILPTGYRFATRVLMNQGGGSLADRSSQWFKAPARGDYLHSTAIVLGDLDGDARLDLVLGSEYYPNPYYYTPPNNRPLRVLLSR